MTSCFDRAVDAQIDTGRWLQVTGKVQQARGLQWLDGEAGTLELAKPPAETPVTEEAARLPAGPPPEVIFSVPTEDETEVSRTTNVRIQFSRDIDPATLKGNVRASYLPAGAAGGVEAGPVDFTTRYNAPNRALVVAFTQPLDRFRIVRLDLLEGILGTDKQPLKPWTLTFAVGGS